MAKTAAAKEHVRLNRLFSHGSDIRKTEQSIFTLTDFKHLKRCPACTAKFARLLQQSLLQPLKGNRALN